MCLEHEGGQFSRCDACRRQRDWIESHPLSSIEQSWLRQSKEADERSTALIIVGLVLVGLLLISWFMSGGGP